MASRVSSLSHLQPLRKNIDARIWEAPLPHYHNRRPVYLDFGKIPSPCLPGTLGLFATNHPGKHFDPPETKENDRKKFSKTIPHFYSPKMNAAMVPLLINQYATAQTCMNTNAAAYSLTITPFRWLRQ